MKALFVVLGFFVAGFVLGSIGPEPYPALMLPAFHGPAQNEDGDLVYLAFEDLGPAVPGPPVPRDFLIPLPCLTWTIAIISTEAFWR